MYLSKKVYEHIGSTVFRQHRAHSHCNRLHGYSFSITLTFGADELDVTNWVCDFGSLKSFKGILEDLLDHTTLIAEDDPHLGIFQMLDEKEIIKLIILPSISCERIASYIAGALEVWLMDNGYSPRVWVVSVEVKEHTGNGAVYIPNEDTSNT